MSSNLSHKPFKLPGWHQEHTFRLQTFIYIFKAASSITWAYSRLPLCFDTTNPTLLFRKRSDLINGFCSKTIAFCILYNFRQQRFNFGLPHSSLLIERSFQLIIRRIKRLFPVIRESRLEPLADVG